MKKIKQESKRFKQLISEQLGTGFNCETSATATIPCWTACNQRGTQSDHAQSVQVNVEVGGCACVNNQFGAGQFPDLLSCEAALPGCCSQTQQQNKVSIWRCEDERGCKEEKLPNSHAAMDILTTENGVYKTKKECGNKCGRKDLDYDKKDKDNVDSFGIKKLKENFYSQYDRLFLTEQKGSAGSTNQPCGNPIPNASNACEQCGFWETHQPCTNLSCWTDCPNPFPITIGATNQNQSCEDFTYYPGPYTGPACYHTNCDPPYFSSEPTCSNSQNQVICWTDCPNYPQTDPATSQTFSQGTNCGSGAASGYPRWDEPNCGMMWYMVRCWTDCPNGGGSASNALFGQNTGNPAQCGDISWGSQNYPNTQEPSC